MAHVLVLPYPSQGHINPMLQFSKHLAPKGPRITLVTTLYITNSIKPQADPISIASISDGYDQGGVGSAPNLEVYLESLGVVGAESLKQLIEEFNQSNDPFTCMVYDTYVPWAVNVAREVGLPCVAFSTQSCAVSAIYRHVAKGAIEVPHSGPAMLSNFGLPPMVRSEFPSFSLKDGAYPTLAMFALEQFDPVGENDWILFNSFDDLENEVRLILKNYFHARNIGPCVPPLPTNDTHTGSYGINLLEAEEDTCLKWLNTKPAASVIYISFGSFATVNNVQMEELKEGLKASNKYFLWVIRDSVQKCLPEGFTQDFGEKGLIVTWSPQLKVLANKALGCFITHCGWNSTLESVSYGVPMIAMAQWTDQPTNAKFIEDVWRVGVRATLDEDGVAKREEIKRCIEDVMTGVKGEAIKRNAEKFKDWAKATLSEGGSSDKNLNEFADYLNALAEKKMGLGRDA